VTSATIRRPRNDPAQYEDLAATWWEPHGPLAMLHWIAAARAGLVPPAARQEAVLVDLGCGAGLLAPHLAGRGYIHVGVDLSHSALEQATAHGMVAIRGDVLAVPLSDGVADVVTAGEILEHVTDLSRALAEACRLLRPGGTLVIDTIASTWLARLIAVEIGERIPGGAPPGIHDPALFVNRDYLVGCCAANGVQLTSRGLRPSAIDMIGWLARRRDQARMVKTASTAVLFQGVGVKEQR
jgi:2-polyprenyl-6-hydroxyphenyl methylase/3-demethylubiquinone-9 3-methyltransferase